MRRFVIFLRKNGLLTSLIFFVAFVAAAQTDSAPEFTIKALPLPGAQGLVMLDYIAYDPVSHRLWVPAGNLGSVDAIDGATDEIKQVGGFAVAQVELRGKSRPVGPSSLAIGHGVVYIGSRADSKICTIYAPTLKLGDCVAFAPPLQEWQPRLTGSSTSLQHANSGPHVERRRSAFQPPTAPSKSCLPHSARV